VVRFPFFRQLFALTGSLSAPYHGPRSRLEAAGRALVILDSDHHADHVYEEMRTYSAPVQPRDYLIVEDTNLNGHPAFPEFGSGPMEAVDKFLSQNDDFVFDERCERFLLTLNPRGYLRRKST
jgi:cephalosporin hydroxylase